MTALIYFNNIWIDIERRISTCMGSMYFGSGVMKLNDGLLIVGPFILTVGP